MARTPLFREVRRALALAQRSLHTGEPPAELVEKVREEQRLARQQERRIIAPVQEGITRRQFLGYTSAAAAALALQSCAPWLGGTRRIEDPVVIVGAGIAGLTAAYRLRQAGVPVRILEAQNRIGGRMLSIRDYFAEGQVAELGGELINSDHVHIRGIAEEMGIELNDLETDDAQLTHDLWFFGGQRRTEAEVVAAFLPIASRIEQDLGTITADGEVTYRTPSGAVDLDWMTIAQWLDRAGASGWIRSLLEVAYTAEYGLETDRQSALNLLFVIDPRPEPFQLLGEGDERYHTRGGNDRIPRALASRLEDAIELNSHLEAISLRPDGWFVCSVRRGESSLEVPASHLLLALPFTLLRQVRLDLDLPPWKRQAIQELGYGTNAKLMVGFSERVWRTAHRSNGSTLTDLPYQVTWETSRLQPGRTGILTNFTGGEQGIELGRGTPADQAALLTAQLERVFPGIRATREGMREARFHWPTHPYTLGSYSAYLPGQWTRIRGAEGESWERLYFAGEHCSLEHQGFMEGGCETGEAAADEILQDLGIRRRQRPRREPVAIPA